jgi:hypothetical protein
LKHKAEFVRALKYFNAGGGCSTGNSGMANHFDIGRLHLQLKVFWLTMMDRSVPDASPTPALTPLEIRLLNQLAKAKNCDVHKENRFPPI